MFLNMILKKTYNEVSLVTMAAILLGYSRNNSPPPPQMASWKSRWEGGQEGLEIQVGGGYRLENSSSGVIFDRCIKD